MGKSEQQLNSKLRKLDDFIPPDGGWGWMIVFAAGFSNLALLPMLQQFGLLFRDRFQELKITSSQTTTIINLQSALAACVGLANGPLFRLFTYRQVSLAGALVVFVALLGTTFSYSFSTYLISFSILYGAGYGVSSSANALALNTYWKNRRRLATGLSWTTTGLGPILWPQIMTGLFAFYGDFGTTLILTGFALHAVACALLLQPVKWHAKKPDKKEETDHQQKKKIKEEPIVDKKQESRYFSPITKIKSLSAISSQYLYNEDDPLTPGYEIIDPGIPMMIRANDGYFSLKNSRSRLNSRESSNVNSRLNSTKPSMANLLENRSRKSSTLYLNESKKNSAANLGLIAQETKEIRNKPKRKKSVVDIQILESEIEDCPTLKAPQDLKAEEKVVVENIDPEHAKKMLDKEGKRLAESKSKQLLRLDSQYEEKHNKDNQSNISSKHNIYDGDERKYLKDNRSNQSYRFKDRHRKKSNNFNYESEVLKQASLKLEQYLQDSEINEQKLKLLIASDLDDDDEVFDDKSKTKNVEKEIKEKDVETEEKLTFLQKVALFFDLDLLKDFTFVNLMLGITLATFNEMNFSILTPFILGDFGLSKPEVALFMSLLAGVDICVRFCIPFVAGKIGWDNKSFYLFGVLSMAMGRVVLAYCQKYTVVLIVAVIIGFGKGLRTVFSALIIPTYVPLHKLPGASGLQLMTAGVVYLSLGPVVGWIKDNASTAVTLHCLNIFTWLTALSWGLEKYIITKRQKKIVEHIDQA